MYPLSIILPIAVYTRWQKLPKLVLPMCLMEVMHIFPPAPCNVFSAVPCEVDLLMISTRSTWLAVPLLSLIAFVLIGVGMVLLHKSQVWAMEEE